MAEPQDPITDPRRLTAVRRAGLVDSPPEEAFDRLVRAAAAAANAPVALVSIVDEDRQYFKSSTAKSGPFLAERDTTLALSLCRHAVAARQPLLLTDARNSPDFSGHQAVREGHVGAYAGYPITLDGGQVIGTVCVLDSQPRDWGTPELDVLRSLAEEASAVVARQAISADARAWRSAARAGITEALPEAGAGQPGFATLPAFLAHLDQGTPPAAERSPAETHDALVAAAYFWTRQMDAYLASLESGLGPNPGQENRLRSDIMSAEATLLRAVGDFDGRNAAAGTVEDPAEPRLVRLRTLRDACEQYLDAEAQRTRTSLSFRRGLAQLDEFERSTIVAAEAEQAMRLALRAIEMGRG